MVREGLRLLTLLIIIVGLYYAGKHVHKKVLAHQQVMVHCATTIAPHAAEQIRNYCEQHGTLHNPYHWIEELKKTFPIVSDVLIKKETNNIITIVIESHTCKLILNNTICVAYNGAQYPTQLFDKNMIKQTLKIQTQELESSKELDQFIRNISVNILNNYLIIWQSPYEIYLVPQDKKYQILIRYDQLPNETQLRMGNNLYEQEAKINNTIIDLRFNDQIRLFANRGKRDGKGILR